MDVDRKIKRFNEFMNGPRLHRSLDLTIISGTLKGGFFSKDKPFELYLYHTPVKHKILDHKIVGTTFKELKISLRVGDGVDMFREWAEKNGYKIEEFSR
jgi:hypothetical protein